jgi:hypothetical protein
VKALVYAENQWPTLVRFMDDGRVPIHNNSCEDAIRPLAGGCRNWLLAGSERGGHAAATTCTLIENCRRIGVHPFVHLRDVLVRVCTHQARPHRRARAGELERALRRTGRDLIATLRP